ncbi:MAG: hypothetical protein LBC60_11180, partial [Spirochaetaceae bacterium]|nr:hypothetical protein [Spirochaetaceae bacterium]
PPLVLAEDLDRLVLMKESFLMGFRTPSGPDEGLFRRRFGLDVGECIPETLKRWRERGLIRPERPALTREGILFLNPFLTDCFAEATIPGVRGPKVPCRGTSPPVGGVGVKPPAKKTLPNRGGFY